MYEFGSLFLLLQNMLVEIEQKVVALSELSVHNENLLMEGKAHTKDEAEQLAVKLRTLKGSLLELQRVLHDKQINIRVSGSFQLFPWWAGVWGFHRNFMQLGKRVTVLHQFSLSCSSLVSKWNYKSKIKNCLESFS